MACRIKSGLGSNYAANDISDQDYIAYIVHLHLAAYRHRTAIILQHLLQHSGAICTSAHMGGEPSTTASCSVTNRGARGTNLYLTSAASYIMRGLIYGNKTRHKASKSEASIGSKRHHERPRIRQENETYGEKSSHPHRRRGPSRPVL